GNDQGTDAVGEQVLFDDAAVGGAQSPGSGDVFRFLQGQDLAAHDTGHADPVQQRKHDEDADQVGAQGLQPAEAGHRSQTLQRRFQGEAQQNNQQNIGDGVDDIGDTHHDHIHPAAEEGGDGAIDGADNQDHGTG